jgi:hypothetical protein
MQENYLNKRIVKYVESGIALPSNFVSAESVNAFKSFLDRQWGDMGIQTGHQA